MARVVATVGECLLVAAIIGGWPLKSMAFAQWHTHSKQTKASLPSTPSRLPTLFWSKPRLSSSVQVVDGARTQLSATPSTTDAATTTSNDPASTSSDTNELNVKTADILSLDSIRSNLIRQEETIIFALIERAQYRQNSIVYRPGGFGSLGIPPGSFDPAIDADLNPNNNFGEVNGASVAVEDSELSFLEYFLVGTEVLHSTVRRYTSPEEHPFFPERLPPNGPLAALPKLDYPQDLLSSAGQASQVNFNKRLLQRYIDDVIPNLCGQEGDDEQHGSTVLADIAVLQALSRRIHYGKFVAESKFLSDPEAYQKLVEDDDADGVMALLTNAVVEAQVLRRARLKATTYGTEPILVHHGGHNDDIATVAAAAASAVAAAMETIRLDDRKTPAFSGANSEEEEDNGSSSSSSQRQPLTQRAVKVDPLVIEGVYRDIIIPMTKDVEVAYLFRRCGRSPPPPYDV
ncbi:hypothetical protein ACA910_013331 [Epithemia clementina (nom. ined.)]